MSLSSSCTAKPLEKGSTVLLTGITGYLGAHIADQLINEDYIVKAVVRNAATARESLPPLLQDHFQLELVEVEDLVHPNEQLGAQLVDIQGAILSACPPPHSDKSNEEGILQPSIDMTLGFLKLAHIFGRQLRRVIFTGSLASTVNYSLGTKPIPVKHYSVSDSTPITWEQACTTKDFFPLLSASKLFSEQHANQWVDTFSPRFEVTHLNPSVILGPFLSLSNLDSLRSTPAMTLPLIQACSLEQLADAVKKETYFPLIVDVRDVAKIHVTALTVPSPLQRRYYLSQGNYDQHEMATILAKTPNFYNFHSTDLQLTEAGIQTTPANTRGYYTVDTSDTLQDFNFRFRPLEQTIRDMAFQFKKAAKA